MSGVAAGVSCSDETAEVRVDVDDDDFVAVIGSPFVDDDDANGLSISSITSDILSKSAGCLARM